MIPFAERVCNTVKERTSAVVIGLDPYPELIPRAIVERGSGVHPLERIANAVLEFNTQIIDSVADLVVAVKPQSAFYERLGVPGIHALLKTIEYAKSRNLLVILDAKRNDIGSTAQAYADAYLGKTQIPGLADPVEAFPVDAITINPYLGSDGLTPFVSTASAQGKGVFVLVRTSNPSSAELQGLCVCRGDEKLTPAEIVAEKVSSMSEAARDANGYGPVGAVMGATFPREAKRFRQLMPYSWFLVPGVGFQGGSTESLSLFFNSDGLGALVSSSRSLLYAYRERRWQSLPFAEATRCATEELRAEVETARQEARK